MISRGQWLDSGDRLHSLGMQILSAALLRSYGAASPFPFEYWNLLITLVGTATVFKGNYWLVATSVAFAEPGDPSDLITAALGALS